MSPSIDCKLPTAKAKTYLSWLLELKRKLIYLTRCPEYLTEEDIDALGIELSEMDFITGIPVPASSATQFFKPIENNEWALENSGVKPLGKFNPSKPSKFTLFDFSDSDDSDSNGSGSSDSDWGERESYWGTVLLNTLERHSRELQRKNSDKFQWEYVQHFFRVRGGSYERDTKYKPSFNTERAFQVVEKQKPHLMFSITSDFRAKEDRITAIEVLEILNDMRSAMKRQIFVSSHKIRWLDDSELHMIFPVLIFSVLTPVHGRFIQCYFDGKLRIQYSKLQKFSTPNCLQLFETVIKWRNPVSCGDTLLDTTLSSNVVEDAIIHEFKKL